MSSGILTSFITAATIVSSAGVPVEKELTVPFRPRKSGRRTLPTAPQAGDRHFASELCVCLPTAVGYINGGWRGSGKPTRCIQKLFNGGQFSRAGWHVMHQLVTMGNQVALGFQHSFLEEVAMSVVVQNSLKPCGLILLACLAPWRLSVAEATEQRVEANRLVEFTFTSEKVYNDPFNEVELAAVFRTPQGRELRVPAFWAGGRVWKVRYSSAAIGRHTFRTECSDTANGKLHGATGLVEVVPYQGDNPLYRHGPMRVAADHRHFEHADGTPFFWLGDTWWMGLCQRLHWPEDFQTLAADRKAKGFNVVQIVAGLYPDMPAFDPRGANEAGFPWEKDYARIRPEYFDQADQRLAVPGRPGFRAVHRRGLGLSSALAGRRAHEEALALPGRALRRAAGGVVRGGRGHHALLRLPAARRRRGLAEARLERGHPLDPLHRSVRPDDHHPSLAVPPGKR